MIGSTTETVVLCLLLVLVSIGIIWGIDKIRRGVDNTDKYNDQKANAFCSERGWRFNHIEYGDGIIEFYPKYIHYFDQNNIALKIDANLVEGLKIHC